MDIGYMERPNSHKEMSHPISHPTAPVRTVPVSRGRHSPDGSARSVSIEPSRRRDRGERARHSWSRVPSHAPRACWQSWFPLTRYRLARWTSAYAYKKKEKTANEIASKMETPNHPWDSLTFLVSSLLDSQALSTIPCWWLSGFETTPKLLNHYLSVYA